MRVCVLMVELERDRAAATTITTDEMRRVLAGTSVGGEIGR